MKIWEIVKEDFEGKQPLEEDWKKNLLVAAISLASVFGSAKAQQDAKGGSDDVKVGQQVKDSTMKLDISKLFTSGKYRFNEKDNAAIQQNLREFGKQVLANPTSDFTIQIVSSESQVPNYDAEPSSPTYQQALKKGDLAAKRAETVNVLMTDFANALKKQGVLKGNVKFTAPVVKVGDVPWPSVGPDGQKLSKDDQQYKKDQYVYMNIQIKKGAGGNTANYTPNSDPFAAFADMGEIVYNGSQAYAMIFYPTRDTKAATDAGSLNTQQQDVLLKTVKANTQLNGKKDQPGVYTGNYVIPVKWWNANVANKSLTPDNIQYITSHFAAK
jgi:hypothetical protein